MANPDIVSYIKSRLDKGMAPEAVRDALKNAGWSDHDIEEALKEVAPISGATQGDVSDEIRKIKAAIEGFNIRLSKIENQPVAPVFQKEAISEKRVKEGGTHIASYSAPALQTNEESGEKESFENKVTGTWFAGVGIVAILVGVAFFLKYAFDNNYIGVTGRVIMGIVAGLVLLGLGDYLQSKEKYRQYSFFISGGGLALLYLSIYGAFAYYQLIGQVPAFAFMVCITAAGAVISLRSDAVQLAAMSLLGGFLTPFLISSGVDNEIVLFTYVLILNLGFLLISAFKKWPALYYLNFIGTYAIFFSWMAGNYSAAKLWTTLFFLTAFLIIFLIAPFLLSILRGKKSGEPDVLISGLNALAYFATAYSLLKPDYEPYLGFFFVIWSFAYLCVAYILSITNREDKYGVYALAGVGLLLLTLAIPIQLHERWITMAWAIEAVVLTWFGFELKGLTLRKFAYLVLGIAVIRLFIFDVALEIGSGDFIPFFNNRFLSFAVVAASLFASSYLYRLYKEELNPDERSASAVLGVVGNLILVSILSIESSTYFDKQIVAAQSAAIPNSVYNKNSYYKYNASASPEVQSLRNLQNLSLSVIWGVYAAILMVVGILKHSRASRILALVGFGIVVLKVFLYDASYLSDLYRIASFIILGLLLLVVSFLFYRYKEKIKEFILAS